MKNFGLRLTSWLDKRDRWSSASAWLKGFSSAATRPMFLIALVMVLVPITLIAIASKLRATVNTITVNSLLDPASVSGNGFCTLREAINNANAASDTTGGDCVAGTGDDTIVFTVIGLIGIQVQGTLPLIANTLTIDGSGQDIAIDGGGAVGVLAVNSGATLSLIHLTISHGSGTTGGGVF